MLYAHVMKLPKLPPSVFSPKKESLPLHQRFKAIVKYLGYPNQEIVRKIQTMEKKLEINLVWKRLKLLISIGLLKGSGKYKHGNSQTIWTNPSSSMSYKFQASLI